MLPVTSLPACRCAQSVVTYRCLMMFVEQYWMMSGTLLGFRLLCLESCPFPLLRGSISASSQFWLFMSWHFKIKCKCHFIHKGPLWDTPSKSSVHSTEIPMALCDSHHADCFLCRVAVGYGLVLNLKLLAVGGYFSRYTLYNRTLQKLMQCLQTVTNISWVRECRIFKGKGCMFFPTNVFYLFFFS